MTISNGLYDSLSIGTVVAFDVETTGLDFQKDEILEVGMVRMERGRIVERFSQLIKPSVSIPPFITQLTGICDEDCENQPVLEDILGDIISFFGQYPIVAHNAPFDMGFLQNALKALQPDTVSISPDCIYDTLDLSRLMLPWLTDHRLETIADFFELKISPTHRAVDDAEVTACIFSHLVSHSLGLNRSVLRTINRILESEKDGLHCLFQSIAQIMEASGSDPKIYKRKNQNNILGDIVRKTEQSGIQKITEEDIDSYFSDTGILSGILPKYEMRKPQLEMARQVRKSFHSDQFLLAEAGTGVGKSLAYLVPVTLWVTRNHHARAVISTHTRTLQDQLFSKELPILHRVSDRPFLAVVLKGRSNYLCKNRWEKLLHDLDCRLTPSQRRRLLPLVLWTHETQTGDVEENAGFGRERNHDIWSLIQSESTQCLGSRCEYESTCYFQRIRRAAKQAGIVVVNHSLLFADIASNHTILGSYDTLVIDEAHQIERIASQSLGKIFHFWLFRDIANRIYQKTDSQETGILIAVQKAIRLIVSDDILTRDLERIVGRLKSAAGDFLTAARTFFQCLSDVIIPLADGFGVCKKMRIKNNVNLFDSLRLEMDRLNEIMDVLSSDLTKAASLLFTSGFPDDLMSSQSGFELESILNQLKHLKELLSHFCRENTNEDVIWCETIQKGERIDTSLYSVPLAIAPVLSDSLYLWPDRCLLTSATLTVGGEFDYVKSRLGIGELDTDRVACRVFGSPFDFSEQSLLLIPTFLPKPGEKSFSSDVSFLLRKILSIHSKGTLVLFTSYQMLKEVYRTLQPQLGKNGVKLLAQGIDGSRSALLSSFQKDEKSVLLGTSSFWEGVDVPGSALELLVITKIPFDVPTEPLVEARTEWAETVTGNGFLNYSVPEAIVRLRQGFGRLIRSREDRGVVLILDQRVINSYYGSLFLDSLPVDASTCDDEESLLEILENWFE